MKEWQETRKTRALDLMAQEQDQLPPARIKAAWVHHQWQAASKLDTTRAQDQKSQRH
jgi:hypothetical protein